jgi:hypothetical protein
MHRIQIYFEQDLFKQIKQTAVQNGQSISAYIHDVLRSEIECQKSSLRYSRFTDCSRLY